MSRRTACVPVLLQSADRAESRRAIVRSVATQRMTLEMAPDAMPLLRERFVVVMEAIATWDTPMLFDVLAVGVGAVNTTATSRGMCIARILGVRVPPGLLGVMGRQRVRLIAH